MYGERVDALPVVLKIAQDLGIESVLGAALF